MIVGNTGSYLSNGLTCTDTKYCKGSWDDRHHLITVHTYACMQVAIMA